MRIDVFADICSTTSRTDCGPRLQLMPATSAPSELAMFATSSGGSPPLVRRDVPDGGEHAPRGADRAGDEDGMAADLARVACQPRRLEVDVADLSFEPIAREAEPVGAEGIGFDDVGAGGDVLLVDAAN